MRSRLSPPLMRMPCSAPLPVPTMMAVGVARPNAHGQATTRTATAATMAIIQGLLEAAMVAAFVDALLTLPTMAQPSNVSEAITRTIGTQMPEMVSAKRWLGAVE